MNRRWKQKEKTGRQTRRKGHDASRASARRRLHIHPRPHPARLCL